MRGVWMQVRDPELLVAYMNNKDFSQSRLARYVGCSRQFVHMLATGERTTCTKQVGELIEEALGVLPGTLFLAKKSPTVRHNVAKKATGAVQAA
ncbi:transcriptional regulator with XRE-family HTH domain [Rhodococcus sp. 27YEA15]|uniref:helix-turn-helix domain-containing protein n=1 Tax=Rhodococcus sp. 27YEA15 TaxID=3156259 RepID=UPI003C7CCCD0